MSFYYFLVFIWTLKSSSNPFPVYSTVLLWNFNPIHERTPLVSAKFDSQLSRVYFLAIIMQTLEIWRWQARTEDPNLLVLERAPMNGKCLEKVCSSVFRRKQFGKAQENSPQKGWARSGVVGQELGYIFMFLKRKPEVAAIKYGEEYAGNAKFCIQNLACIFEGRILGRQQQ